MKLVKIFNELVKALGGQRALLSAKYGTFSESVVTHDYQNSQHYGSFVVGTPGEEISVIYDTDSFRFVNAQLRLLWMVLKSQFLPRKQIRHLLKANGSIFKIKYGSGTVSDFSSKNTVNIGGMSITDYTFAEVSDASGQE